MLKSILSDDIHYLVSFAIPFFVGLIYGVDYWIWAAAIILCWFICKAGESYIIRRSSLEPPGFLPVLMTVVLYIFSFAFFYAVFFTTYSSAGAEATVELKVVSLSMALTSAAGILYWISTTIYVEDFGGYEELSKREFLRGNE